MLQERMWDPLHPAVLLIVENSTTICYLFIYFLFCRAAKSELWKLKRSRLLRELWAEAPVADIQQNRYS